MLNGPVGCIENKTKTKNVVLSALVALVVSVSAFAGEPVNSRLVVVNQKSGLFRVIYEGTKAGRVSMKIMDENAYAKKLQALFAKNDHVVFLFVSVDRDKEAWKKLVLNDKDFKGVHINQLNLKTMSSYMISGVPRYILIDSEGKIAKPYAPRPSSGEVENEIRRLLLKMTESIKKDTPMAKQPRSVHANQ